MGKIHLHEHINTQIYVYVCLESWFWPGYHILLQPELGRRSGRVRMTQILFGASRARILLTWNVSNSSWFWIEFWFFQVGVGLIRFSKEYPGYFFNKKNYKFEYNKYVCVFIFIHKKSKWFLSLLVQIGFVLKYVEFGRVWEWFLFLIGFQIDFK